MNLQHLKIRYHFPLKNLCNFFIIFINFFGFFPIFLNFLKINFNENYNYSKNYLNHLVNSNEILGSMLLTWHNIAFYQDLMKKIRQAIKENKFEEFYKKHFELFNEVN